MAGFRSFLAYWLGGAANIPPFVGQTVYGVVRVSQNKLSDQFISQTFEAALRITKTKPSSVLLSKTFEGAVRIQKTSPQSGER